MEQWNSVKNPPETKVSHREAAHSRGCTSDRRVSAQCYRLRRDGSTGRRSGGGQGFDGLSLFTIGSRKVFIYNRTSKSLWIKIFFPPELAIVPFRLTFLKLQKKKITACAAKSVLRTVHTHPSAEVFLRSMRKWGGSFAEVYFIKCPHPT